MKKELKEIADVMVSSGMAKPATCIFFLTIAGRVAVITKQYYPRPNKIPIGD